MDFGLAWLGLDLVILHTVPPMKMDFGLAWLGLDLVILHTVLPMKMEQLECSETSAYKIQTPGNYPEKSIKNFLLVPEVADFSFITESKHKGSSTNSTAFSSLDLQAMQGRILNFWHRTYLNCVHTHGRV